MPIDKVWDLVVVLLGVIIVVVIDDWRKSKALTEATSKNTLLQGKLDITEKNYQQELADLQGIQTDNLKEIKELQEKVEKLSLAPWQVEHPGPLNIE